MENVWYFAAACVFIFLFGNLAMLQTYHGFVETSTSSRRPQYRGQGGKRAHLDLGDAGNGGMNSIQQLSRELLANKNLLQHARGSEYFVMESRLRKLMEITPDSAYSVNATSALISRYLDFSTSGPAMLDCRTIDNIKHREYVASGWTKAVFSGVHAGRKVALKTVDIGGQDVMACMDGGGSLQQCYHRAAQKIVKEIVLLQALAHDNVIQVRSVPFCHSPLHLYISFSLSLTLLSFFDCTVLYTVCITLEMSINIFYDVTVYQNVRLSGYKLINLAHFTNTVYTTV